METVTPESVADIIAWASTIGIGFAAALLYQVMKPKNWDKWQVLAASFLSITGSHYGISVAAGDPSLVDSLWVLTASSATYAWLLTGKWGEKTQLNGAARFLRFVAEFLVGTADVTEGEKPKPPGG